MSAGDPLPSHRLVEFLTAMTRCADSDGVRRTAAELATEEFDGELGAVLQDDRVRATFGFGRGPVPEAALRPLRPGVHALELDGIGACHALVGRWSARRDGRLVVIRRTPAFETDERNLMLGMARAVSLAMDTTETLERERGRQRVLEVLLGIQRQISHAAPLREILDAVTDGAATVLGGRQVTLRLHDAHPAVSPPDASQIAVPVHIKGVRAGALVASYTAEDPGSDADHELLQAFAEHASLALTDARTAEEVREALRDGVTGLPSRSQLVQRLEQALARRRDGGPEVCALFIDLDRFKAVNDSLGHAAGDDLLRAAGERIVACTPQEGTVARFGGDEFAVVLEGDMLRGKAWTVADRIIRALREPFSVAGKVVHVGTTVGIAHAEDGATAEGLISDADIAMYEAKRTGGAQARAFDPAMRTALRDRLELEAELEHALTADQLALHFQPLVSLATGATTGVEALVRWQHPSRGLVPPCTFVPVAEATGAILDIGRWVLRESCRRLADWRAAHPDLHANVNVSVNQLRDPRFPAHVAAALHDTRLPGDALTLEITESLLLEDHGATLHALNELKALGVTIALDDFGTGYSSLSYLHRFPVDVLKIDRSFVSGAASGVSGDQLVRTIVELGRTFGFATVAEGVETSEQCARLRELGCPTAQGYHFAKPMDAAALTDWLAARDGARAPAPAPLV